MEIGNNPIKTAITVKSSQFDDFTVGTKHVLFGQEYEVAGYNYTFYNPHFVEVELTLWPVHKPKPKSEAELQLEQTIKLTEQDIEHKKRLIEQYEAKRVELEKQRLGN